MKEEKIKEYLLENIDTLKEIVSELNSWNGCLDWLEYWENDEEFFSCFFNNSMEAVRACCYGEYNYCDEYVHLDAYGNLESCSEWELEDELKSYIDDVVENLLNEQDNITIYDSELEALIEEEDEEVEE